MRENELEYNVRSLVDTKLLHLDVTLAAVVKGGALSGLDPWDVFCGNGWIIRRRSPGPGPRFDFEGIRGAIREELAAGGFTKA
jgi:hypothetical protein